MTSSARPSSIGGISSPSALAVLRLITNSNLTGNCTGSSLGLRAHEDAVGVVRCAPEIIDQVIPIGEQATELNEETERIDGWKAVAYRQCCNLRAMGAREGIRQHDQAAIWRVRKCGNYGFELRGVVNVCGARLHWQGHGGGFEGVQPIFATRACPSGSLSGYPISAPMRRIRSGCCARATSGYTVPPSSVRNSRRLMGTPSVRGSHPTTSLKSSCCASQHFGPPDFRNGL